MANVSVEKVRDGESAPPTLFERMAAIVDKVRQRAFEVFESRHRVDDHSLDDWLQAERDVIHSPQAELTEKDGKFQVRVAISGFAPKDIRVTAMPTFLVIDAESKHEREQNGGDVHFCEFGQKQLFRRLDLPAAINVANVTATLDHGMLQITAPKAADTTNKVKVTTAA